MTANLTSASKIPGKTPAKPAAKPAVADIYPLTPLQKGLLFHALYEPESAAYFEQLCVRLDGALDERAFEEAWRRLIDRHAILRSAFVTRGQREPVQVVFDRVPFAVTVEDWSALDDAGQAARLDGFLEEDRRRGFAFNRPPLMRITLIRLGADRWQLVWSHHHLLLDGWSLPILMGELFALYRSGRDGTLPALATPVPYGDYVAWLGRQDRASAEAFWRDELAELESPTPLGIDARSTGARAPASDIDQRVHQLAPSLTAALADLARRSRVTLASVIESAWAIVLSRYAGTDDVTFGITLSSRPADLPGAERMVGLFVNSLPLRIRIDAARPVADLLRLVQDRQLAVQRFDHCSLTDIQSWSSVPRGEPLFESLFAFENFPLGDKLGEAVPEIAIRDARLIEKTHYPLTLIVVPGETLVFKVAVDRERIVEQAASGIFDHLSHVLTAMAGDPAQPVSAIGLLPAAKFAAPVADMPPAAAGLREAFNAVVARFPDRVALVDGDVRLTYADLAGRAATLSKRLRAAGVGPGQPVGICLERSADLIAAMLAVVEAGGAYLPLDPAYPPERLAFLVQDSGAGVVITASALAGRLPDGPLVIRVDEAAGDGGTSDGAPESDPEDTAYIIYTSGSTGTPKGVLVTHRNVLRLFSATDPWFRFNERDVWTLFHSFAFDFSVWEIWGALLHGGTLVIVPWLVSRDPDAFLGLLERERVTVLNQTPSAFTQLIAADAARTERPDLALRTVVFGGEALEPAMLAGWVARRGDRAPELINMYGITETTVHVTYRPIRRADIEAGSRSVIGRPIPDLSIEILDQHRHPVPPGAIGEICVGGAGVPRGYLNRPELTAERFIEVASDTGTMRLYRSGDLARRLPDGDIEYCGRSDHQVKVRGFRIETGEIEAALTRHPAIAQALVLAPQGPDGRRLVAWLAMRQGPGDGPGADDLRNFLRNHLPVHMVPEAFVPLDAFPLTVNGKIDRAALPDPDDARAGSAQAYAAPETDTQRILCEAWGTALGVERVGIDDDYFTLGGDSIRSIRVVALAREKGVTAILPQLFTNPTVRRLSAVIDTEPQATKASAPQNLPAFALISDADRAKLPTGIVDAYPLTRLQAGMLFHGDFDAEQSLYQDLFLFRLRVTVDTAALEAALTETIAIHPALRTSFDLETASQPMQLVHGAVASPLTVTDLRGLPAVEQERRLAEHIATERRRGYDWSKAPCGRIDVHLIADNEIHLSVGFHHAVLDGWSVATFQAEWVQRYLHRLGRGVGRLPATPTTQFRDFVALERQALTDPGIRGYWETALAGLPIVALPRLKRPADAPRPPGKLDRELPPGVKSGLKEITRVAKLPLKALLLAAHLRVLALLGGSPDIVTGLVTNGRPDDQDSTRVLGLFLNTLPFRLKLERRWSWLDLARAVHRNEAALLPNRRLPMSELRKLAGGRALFETSFNFVNFHVYQGLAGLRDIELLDTQGNRI